MTYFIIWYQSKGSNGAMAHIDENSIFSVKEIMYRIESGLGYPEGSVIISGFKSLSRNDFKVLFDMNDYVLLEMETAALEGNVMRPHSSFVREFLTTQETRNWQIAQLKRIKMDRTDRNWMIVQDFLAGSGFNNENASRQHCMWLGFDPDGTSFMQPTDN